jgi:hypothetical protein
MEGIGSVGPAASESAGAELACGSGTPT